ncbi:MAG: hypothetical protein HFJ45_10425 [Clostridia bacterium]|nr:hypothetical protein [Clostridia bacterium]
MLGVINTIPDKCDIIINLVVIENLLATRERYEKSILKNKNVRLLNIEAQNRYYNLLQILF